MRSKILFLLAGMLMGAAAVFVRDGLRPEPVSHAIVSPDVASTTKALANAQNHIQLLESDNAQLSAQLAQARAPATNDIVPASAKHESPWAQMFGGSDTNRPEAMSQMIQAAVKQQIDMKMSGMKLRLKLSEEQEESIRDLLNKQFVAADVWSKMMKGKMTKADAEKQNASVGDIQAQIKDVLNSEQQSEYEKLQTEERQAQAQMVANVETSQLQTMLQLTPEQQDQVFQILYQQSEQMLTQTDGGARIPTDWMRLVESKKEALRGVLTPDQFKSYEKYVASQLEMYKAFLPADGTNSAGAVSISIESSP